MEKFADAANDILTFSRPYLEQINWDLLPDYTLSLQEIFEGLQMEEAHQQFAVALALQSIPSEHRFVDIEGRIGYKLTSELRFHLSNLALPIQAIKMNANHGMDFVRTYFGGNLRFYRCGVQEMGTEKEHILLSFDFPDSISEAEQKQISKDLKTQTGWNIAFSKSIRHEAFQPLLASLLEKPVEMPSVHIQKKLL